MFITFRLKKLLATLAVAAALLLFLLSALRLSGSAVSDARARVPVVMYHHVAEQSSLLGKYVISPAELESDLKYLSEQGYTTCTPSMLAAAVSSGEPLQGKCIVLTFDDGQESFYAYVYPLLQKYSMCACLNVVGEFVERYSAQSDHDLRYSCLTWDELRELAESPLVEIGNHTYALHSAEGSRRGCMMQAGESLESYEAALSGDVGLMQRRLEEELGITAATFAYPFGGVSHESVDILKSMGFTALLTCEERVNIVSGDDWLYNLGRFNRPSGVTSEKFFEETMGLR